MQRRESPFDGFRKLGRQNSTPPAPPVITQTSAPSFGPYTAGQTPAGVYTAGTYASTAGTISSAVPQWTINGVSQPGSTVLAESDVVGLSVLVTDSAANTRTFGYGTTAPAGAAMAPADYIINNDTDWNTVMANSAATLSGKIAEVRGAVSSVSISGKAMSSPLVIRGGAGGSVRRVALTGTTAKITFEDLPFQMTGWPHAEAQMFYLDGGTFDDIKLDGCTFRHGYGAGLANFDMTATYDEYTRVDNVQTATTTATRYALTWEDPAMTEGWIEFFNRGSQTVYVAVGGSGVIATLGSPSCAAGQRLRITSLNPTVDTHFSILTASGTSEVNARAEIGMAKYLADGFAASGSAAIGRLEILNCTFRDIASALKMGARPDLLIIMDNDLDRVYMDNIAIIPSDSGSAYILRNLTSTPFSRSGIAENLSGDAGDPHGDIIQGFAGGTGVVGPYYIGGNRTRRTARRAGVTHQGVFLSDNDFSPSYDDVYIVSELMSSGAVNGINSGEASFPIENFLIWGATVADGNDLAAGTSAIRLTTATENRVHAGKSVVQDVIKQGAGFVIDDVLEVANAASVAALFPNSANIATAFTRSEMETAWATAAEGAGLGAVATANAIDWATSDHTAVILWENVGSGVGWEDLPGQTINSLITLPLRRVLNPRANQTVTPGTGVEWRAVGADGTTEVQAWTTSSGTIQPKQFIQIRKQSSTSGLTAVNFDITINGFLSRTVVTTASAAPSVFHTQSGTGPYFVDPSNVPASTTRIEFRANINAPANPGATVKIFTQESTGCDLAVLSTGVLQVIVEDGAGTAVVNNQNASQNLLTGVWSELVLDVDHTAGTATLTQNGSVIGSWTWTPTASPFFNTAREISFCGTTAGANRMPSGWRVEYAEAYFTTSGVRTLRKRIEGNAATVNADAWKLGGNAT